MRISGDWRNEYESVMTLAEEADGFLHGEFRSSTGSTGTFPVAGFSGANGDGRGTPLALAISWRSIDPGVRDPSWHWVSGLGGQVFDGPGPMPLLHQMVATASFPGIADPGTHLDKLSFRRCGEGVPAASQALLAAHLGETKRTAAADPVEGIWHSIDDDGAVLRLSVRNPHAGIVVGSLTDHRGKADLYGFADIDASNTPIPRQSLSLAGRYAGGFSTVTLAGWLDLERGRLGLSVLWNRGTGADTRYAQTIVEGMRFKPA
jgi:saccharopepsin